MTKMKKLSRKKFKRMIDILLIKNKHPKVSFNDLEKVETTRIKQ